MARNENLVKFALAYPRAFGLILVLLGAAMATYFLIWPAIQMERNVAHIEYSAPMGAVGGTTFLIGLLILVLGDMVIGLALMEHSDRIERYGQTRVYIVYGLLVLASFAFYFFCDQYIAAHGYVEAK